MSPYAYSEYLTSDNALLYTQIVLPEKGGKFPTVIMRTPYVDQTESTPDEELCEQFIRDQTVWLKRGYAVVEQHCRGCGKSTGDCIPYINERKDGLHLQDWIRRQPFYNGELYLFGASYTSSVHCVTAPFAPDIKGIVLKVQDSKRYNANYRNGFYKIGLHGNWYVGMYKKKSIRSKNYVADDFKMLPLSGFSQKVFGEPSEDFDEILKHPKRSDPFWDTHVGGSDGRNALVHAKVPVLLTTGFYDIYTGGIFDMWNALDEETKAISALVVCPYGHSGLPDGQPVTFEKGTIGAAFPDWPMNWMDYAAGKCESQIPTGMISYYNLFANKWCNNFSAPASHKRFPLGSGEVTYQYDPKDPAVFPGGLSRCFGGNAWQDAPNQRQDIVTVYTPEFTENTCIRGKMTAKLQVKSDCEDTCFYIRVSLVKIDGDYGLRDDIQQISNVCVDYTPGETITLDFSFDEHAFLIQKGERLRIDISSSAFPYYVPHTNFKGLFSQQTESKIANNTIILEESTLTLPIA